MAWQRPQDGDVPVAHDARYHLSRYSRFVHLSKFTISIIIIAILLLMVLVPLLGERDGQEIILEFVESEDAANAPPMMLNPRFRGVDSRNQPYLITAESALQASDNVISLRDIEADLTTHDNVWLALKAEQGTLNLEEESLLLQGDVELFHDAGHMMHSKELRVDLKTLNAFTESFVQIQGPFGHITSDRFAIFDKGDRMLFTNNVYLLLLP